MQKAKKFKILLGLVLFCVLIGAITFYVSLAGSNEGTIKKTDQLAPTSTIEPFTNLSYSGKYVRFSYPASFSKPSDTTTQMSRSLEQYSLSRSLSPGFQTLTLNVFELEQGGIQEEPFYTFRKNNSNTYAESSRTVNGTTFTIFSKNDDSELVSFQQNNNLVATIALTSTTGNLDELMSDILQSFSWQ